MPKMIYFDPAESIKGKEDTRYSLIAAFKEAPSDGSLICSTLRDISQSKCLIPKSNALKIAYETALDMHKAKLITNEELEQYKKDCLMFYKLKFSKKTKDE